MLDTPMRDAFARDGFVVLRGVVPPARLGAARAAIARSLEADRSVGQMQRFLSDTFCPDLTRHPDLLALLPPILPSIASIFGAPEPPTADTAQIALRFPQLTPMAHDRFGFHLDGYPSGLNDVPKGTIFRNTLLAGVYLTPLPGPDRGNLVVWPGSHRVFAAHLRALDAPTFLRAHGAEALLAAIREVDPGAPHQVEVAPGDAVLAHHLLAHGAADNFTLHTREAIYFRLLHPRDRANDPEPLMDVARFFDGVRW